MREQAPAHWRAAKATTRGNGTAKGRRCAPQVFVGALHCVQNELKLRPPEERRRLCNSRRGFADECGSKLPHIGEPRKRRLAGTAPRKEGAARRRFLSEPFTAFRMN